MLLELEAPGSTRALCWTDGYRLAPEAGTGSSVLVYMSMFGPHNVVRSRWSKLCERGRTYLSTSAHSYIAMGGEKYLTHTAPLKDKMVHMVILHPAATNQCSVWSPGFFQIGDGSSEKFFPRLNRMCPVPFCPEWKSFLWQEGVASKLIQPLDGIGMPGYQISAKGSDWSLLVSNALKAKKLG